MKLKFWICLLSVILLPVGFFLGKYYTIIIYNPDFRVPQIIELTAKKLPEFSEKYPRIKIADIPKTTKSKAEVLGVVTLVETEPDGDIHVVLADGGARVVGEIIPELKMDPPKEGDSILARGLVWFDKDHKWWELHPIVSWQKVQP